MSVTVYYEGNLTQPDDISTFIEIIKKKAEQYNWRVLNSDSNGIAVDIPECENLVFDFKKGKLDNFVKYWGKDIAVTENIFDVLLAAKPFFKKLKVSDDFGMWEKYISQFRKDTFPPFRELKAIEKEELARCFDLSKDSDSIFEMGAAPAVLMFMICKDMNDDLTKTMTKDMLLSNISEQLDDSFYHTHPDEMIFQFMIIVENWILSKLVGKNGISIQKKAKGVNGYTIFSFLMVEMIFGWLSGVLNAKHSKLHRFVDSLDEKNFDFNDKETFLRLVYSVMEYLGIYRNDNLITRKE